MQPTRHAPDLDDAPASDLGPLAWVFDELRKSLDSANKALKRFATDAAQARESDVSAVDPAPLRLARTQLHQVVGALDMVGFHAPATVVRGMEAAVQRFLTRPALCTDAALAKVERAGFALVDYLEAVLNGKSLSPVALFSQYRDVQELAGAQRIHPADLWDAPSTGADAPMDLPAHAAPAQALVPGPAVRAQFDKYVLHVIKSQHPGAAAQLKQVCAGLAVGGGVPAQVAFWQLAAAYFEAIQHGLLPTDVYVKRAASRVLLQYSAQAQGSGDVSAALRHDLLFFAAQARQPDRVSTPWLDAVRQRHSLLSLPDIDYDQPTLGRFDPALLLQARKRIHAVKEGWALLTGGDTSKVKPVVDQFSLVSDSLQKILPAAHALGQALAKASEAVLKAQATPSPELGMEVATAVLFLEAVLQDMAPSDAVLTERMGLMAERVKRAQAKQPSLPLDGWMEELYRQVSDRHTMGSVVGELKVNLGELERGLDQFSRDPADKQPLLKVPQQLSQMRGVLSVLGLDHAAQTVSHMAVNVEDMLADEVDPDRAREAGTFSHLANNLSALSFLVDMLNYQPVLARKLFVFDTALGELKPLMGRTPSQASLPPSAQDKAAQQLSDSVEQVVQDVADGSADGVSLSELTQRLDVLANQADLSENPSLAQAARQAASTVAMQDPEAGAQALAGLMAAASAPVDSAPPIAPPAQADAVEDDLLDIFLEEARDVIQAARSAIATLSGEPSSQADMTTLRRAFHTLKGSSRMVGLSEFGEAAWAMEQVMNAWLAENKPVTVNLCALGDDAVGQLARWVDDIAAHTDRQWVKTPFCISAQAMRETGEYLPLVAASTGAVVHTDPAEPDWLADEDADGAAEPVLGDAVADAGSTGFPDTEVGDFRDVSGAIDAPSTSESADLLDIDFEALMALDAAEPEVTVDVPNDAASAAAEVGQSDEELLDWGFDPVEEDKALPQDMPDLDVPQAESVDSTFGVDEPLSDTEGLEPDTFDLSEAVVASDAPEQGMGQSLPVFELDFGEPASTEMPDQPLSFAADGGFVSAGEDVKVIGPLRIGVKLFNVYLNEADEWSRLLSHELGEWALEHQEHPVPESAAAWAHSLAGASAAVGFDALADLARALEHALDASCAHAQDGRMATATESALLVDAADDLRRLLHQFAAGFLKEPNPDILLALDDLAHGLSPGPDEGSAPIDLSDGWLLPSDDRQGSPLASPTPAVDAVSEDDTPLPEPEPEPELPIPSVQIPIATRGATAYVDDEFDAVDTLDADLFQIFEEEAQELLPRLGSALRQWVARPGNTSARVEVLRNLHTLKGSARLAGALRLGDMAHRMETQAERLGSDVTDSALVEPLLGSHDALVSRFEELRQPADVPVPNRTTTSAESLVEAPAVAVEAADGAGTLPPASQVLATTQLQMPMAKGSAAVAVRVRPELLDRLVNQTGEVMITRSRMEAELGQLRTSLNDLTGNLDRLRHQLRDIELQAESQMQSRMAQAKDADQTFDPLEFDRFTRVQELTRMMAESVSDVATVQRNLQRAVDATEDGLAAQARQTRELQRDLLRTRMVEFEGIADRLYRVVRQVSKETGKQVRLDIVGGTIEMDRAVLDRMTPAFEHLLRNCVGHGIETPAQRLAADKPEEGSIRIDLTQEGNDVSVVFADDGQGLDLAKIRTKARALGLIADTDQPSEAELAQLIFAPGLTTATEVTGLSGRGIGMDVVRSEVVGLGGRVEAVSVAGQGTRFRMVLPLTTAVTQVVMLRAGDFTLGVPSGLVEVVRRVPVADVAAAYDAGFLDVGGESVPFYWAGALLQTSRHSQQREGRTWPVVIFRSASQRVALHVDEVLGNQEVVVKNLGPQLSRLPGLAAMTVLASGVVALVYNPVALSAVYGAEVRRWLAQEVPQSALQGGMDSAASAEHLPVTASVAQAPLVLVVDDSITVRRVTQRLLVREGYRVAMAIDGLQALERLQQERPAVVLTDIEMPRMDGFDLVRNIRSDPRLADLPIVMITSRIAEKHREHARQLGVDHYLGKPYSEDELLGLLQHFCANPLVLG